MNQFTLLFVLLLLGCKSDKTPTNTVNQNIDLSQLSVVELQKMMSNNQLSSVELTQYYMDRIDTYDQNGPTLKSVLTLNPDALSISKNMDEERKKGKIRGPLHGIPILIKDNIDTRDKMANTAGSLALADNMPQKDAYIVKQLRQAGAVILGKTNLSEWANFRSTSSSSGWSSVNGQTLNPHNISKSPCGSSAGSGAAVAAGLCAIAIGTETNGSIGCPSSVNGVVGIKPTVGLWSRSGIIPISHTQDTAGPMARSVKDAAALLTVCAGADPQDPATTNAKNVVNYISQCTEEGLKGRRIGVSAEYLEIEGEMGKVFSEVLDDLEAEGAEIVKVDINQYLEYENLGEDEFTLLLYEFKDGINKYLSQSNLPYKTLNDLIEYNKKNKDKVMPIFQQEIFDMAEATGTLSDTTYLNAKQRLMDHTRGAIDQVHTAYQIDALVGPTTGPAWDIDHINGDKFNGPSSYGVAAISGYPHINVPMGDVEGLPVGVCFIGQAWTEGTLINIAYNYEQASQKLITPKL